MNKFNSENWELITRILTGEVSENKQDQFERWLAEDPQRAAFFRELKAAWEEEPDEHSVDASYLFDLESGRDKLRKKIKADANIRFKNRVTESDNKPKNRFAWKAAASILVLIASLSIVGIQYFWSPPATTYSTSNIEQRIITLPDGSQVRLNKNSSIKFSEGFKGDKRKIMLKGEAFFEVQHDSTRPFIVSVGNATIRDIGTSFNVKQGRGHQLTVMVKDGIVSLRSVTGDKDASAILRKNQLGRLTADAGIQTQKIDIQNYLSWINGQLVFKKMPLRQVVSQLNNIYGLKSEFADQRLANLKLTAFTHKLNVDEVLEMIALSLNLKYDKKGDTVIWTKR